MVTFLLVRLMPGNPFDVAKLTAANQEEMTVHYGLDRPIPGIGREFVTAVSNRDYTVVMGLTIFIGALIILCNLVADLLTVGSFYPCKTGLTTLEDPSCVEEPLLMERRRGEHLPVESAPDQRQQQREGRGHVPLRRSRRLTDCAENA